jgi:hypothetical protein
VKLLIISSPPLFSSMGQKWNKGLCQYKLWKWASASIQVISSSLSCVSVTWALFDFNAFLQGTGVWITTSSGHMWVVPYTQIKVEDQTAQKWFLCTNKLRDPYPERERKKLDLKLIMSLMAFLMKVCVEYIYHWEEDWSGLSKSIEGVARSDAYYWCHWKRLSLFHRNLWKVSLTVMQWWCH